MAWRPRSDAALGAVSSDNRYLPFLSGNDARGQLLDGRELFVRDLSRGEVRRLTTTASDDESAASDNWCVCTFESGSHQIAYAWWVKPPGTNRRDAWHLELRILDVDVAVPAPRTIYSAAPGTFVEPFAWQRGGALAVRIWDQQTDSVRIAMMPTDGTRPTVLAAGTASRLPGPLTLSPDGRYLAAAIREDTTADLDILLFDLRDDHRSMLVSGSGNDVPAAWTPQGDSLLFVSDRGGNSAVWVVGAALAPRTEPRKLVSGFASDQTLGMTADGRLYYMKRQLRPGAIRIDSVVRRGGSIALHPIDSDSRPFDAWEANLTWSHAGTRLAYVIGTQSRWLVVRTPASHFEHTYRLPLSEIGSLRWCPNDSLLVVSGPDLEGAAALFVVVPETGQRTRLPVSGDFRGWSSESRALFIDRATPEHPDSISVYRYDLATGREREVYRGGSGGPGRLALSGDGRTLFLRIPVPPGRPPHSLIARDVASGAEHTVATSVTLGPLSVSPRGRFVITSTDEGTRLIPADGSAALVLPNASIEGWAQDDRLALKGGAGIIPGHVGPQTVSLLSLDEHEERPIVLSSTDLDDGHGYALSPDGGRLARTLQQPYQFYARLRGMSPKTVEVLDLSRPGAAGNTGAISARSPAHAGQAIVGVSLEDSTATASAFAGFNAALMVSAVPWTDQSFMAQVRSLATGWIRYPAGVRAAAFDWRTGASRQEWVDQFKGTAFVAQIQDAHRVLQAKGGERVDDAAAFAHQVGAAGLIVVVNVYTDTPESAGEFARYARSHGIPVLAWELGNEPTLLPEFFPDATTYAKKMRPFADAIHAADPVATVALSLEIEGLRKGGWDSTLARFTPRYWDLLSYHEYPPLRAASQDLVAALNEVLETESDSYVRDYVARLFGSMPVVVTEAAPGSGNSLPVGTSMIGTLYGGLWAAEFAMRLSTLPQVRHVGFHQLLGPGGIEVSSDGLDLLLRNSATAGAVAPGNRDFGFFPSAQGAVYGVAASVLNRASATYHTVVTGGGTVPVHSSEKLVPALHAQAYRTGATVTLLITNKGSATEAIELRAGGVRVSGPFHITVIGDVGLDTHNTKTRRPVAPRAVDSSGPLLLPPFSLTAISWIPRPPPG